MKIKLFSPVLLVFLLGLTCCNNQPVSEDDLLTFDIYSTNDYHGMVEENENCPGLGKYITYFKQKGELPNTLLIDQGDTWQGSIYSNYNYGALINDAMCYAKFDARTVGNHDFDWGVDYLKANTSREYDGYTIPTLAANVYDFDFNSKTIGNIHQDDIGGKSISYTLENGLKVGIVGVIGSNQITSITSSLIQDLCFVDHNKIIKEEATKLKEEGCQVIIASCHCGQNDVRGNDLGNYVDVVLCGHTHKNEISNEGDLKFYQFGSYGQTFGKITVQYNKKSQRVTSDAVTISGREIKEEIEVVDEKLSNLINQYNSICDEAASEVVASNTEYFSKSEHCPNLMCKAVFDKCVKQGHDDVILTYCNTARNYLPKGQWTYADLYESFPFDNTIYVVSVLGKDIYNEVKNYNNAYFNPNFDCKVKANSYYKIACIDYLIYHTDTNRYYNYFPSYNGKPIDVINNYRVLLKDWLIDNGYNNGKQIKSSDFSSSLDCFNTSKITLER